MVLLISTTKPTPRSFEVVADLVEHYSANKDLLDLQKKMKDLNRRSKESKSTNNLFVGTTKDLINLLEGGARKIKKKDDDHYLEPKLKKAIYN